MGGALMRDSQSPRPMPEWMLVAGGGMMGAGLSGGSWTGMLVGVIVVFLLRLIEKKRNPSKKEKPE